MQDSSVHTWHILSTWVELVVTKNKSSESVAGQSTWTQDHQITSPAP